MHLRRTGRWPTRVVSTGTYAVAVEIYKESTANTVDVVREH